MDGPCLEPDGKKVAAIRKEKGWNQEELAKKAGYAKNTIGNVEAGKPCRVPTLDHIARALGVGLPDLLLCPRSLPTALIPEIRDFTAFVDDRTRDFVGRQSVFDEIDRFIGASERGYFFLFGDPGIGKSALAARLAEERKCVQHYNIRAEGINTAEIFLRSVCAQLIAGYDLAHTSIPSNATQDARFLKQLLNEVSALLVEGDKLIIVVDALDEVSRGAQSEGANPLYLPMTLPKGVFIVVTSRRVSLPGDDDRLDPPLRIDCEHEVFEIKNDWEPNIKDISAFLRNQLTKRSGLRDYINGQGMAAEDFVEALSDRSEGNFMYLHYVLPEIEQGAYSTATIDAIPRGLRNYYGDHWNRMQDQDAESWHEYKLPIIAAIATAGKPISIDLLSEFSKVEDSGRIVSALEDWAQFIHVGIAHAGEPRERYSLYHTSFYDFLQDKGVIKAMARQIGEMLYHDLPFEDQEE